MLSFLLLMLEEVEVRGAIVFYYYLVNIYEVILNKSY